MLNRKAVRDFYRLDKENIKTIQSIELDILTHFIYACHKLNLTYYIHGGTLLGAEMYKGFIPWDDDIDVSMPRDDYQIFINEGYNYLPKNLFIQTCYNDKEYTLCFAKIRNLDTSLVEYSLQNRKKMINGVYIDIFPIDGMNSRKKPLYANLLRRRIDMSYWDIEYCNIIKKIIISLLVFPLLFISANKATQLLDKYRQRIRVQDEKLPKLMLINRWYYPSSYYIPKPNNTVSFCNLKVNTVRKPDEWLLIDYPHYRKIPPLSEQIPGHKLVYHKFK